MKKLIYFALLSLCLFSCIQSPQTANTNKEAVEAKPYKVFEVVDSAISLYPNLYVNDVQKERFCKYLYMELNKKLTEDNAYLSEIPLKFSQMLKKDNGKYILKFECGKYSTNNKQLVSDNSKTEINFAVFTEVDEDFASTLEDNAIYTLTGKYEGYVDGKLTLPSGRVFDYSNSCFKSSSEEYGTVCLGGFLFSDVQVKKNN